MGTYKYRILTKGSAVIEGKRVAESKAKLIDYLKKSGYIVLKIKEVEESKGWTLFSNRSAKKATVMFTQELATLLESGIPLDRSLKILSEAQENKHFSNIILDILEGVKGGKSLAESLSAFNDVFPNIYASMVRAGEESGVLPKVLKRLGSFMERVQKIRAEVISSLIYPIFLVLAGIMSIAALMILVIPKFSEIFDEIGIALPLSTQIIINLSGATVKYGWIAIIVLAGMFFLYKKQKKQSGIQRNIDRRKIRLPIIGGIFWRIEVSRFARTLGTLLENGVPLLNSIDISKGVLANSYLIEIIEEAKPEIKSGKGLTKPLSKKTFFPGIVVHLLSIGEETGTLDEMLVKVSNNLDADVEQRLKRLVALVEPFLILTMGCGIGLIVISMLTAISSINQASF